MNADDWLVKRFEASRSHLKAIAFRMLGSFSEAEDAVQETWLRLHRDGAKEIENLEGWLVTVLTRVCLDALRSRKSRSEERLDEELPASATADVNTSDPEQEAVMVESVGLALLVVLDRLAPAERLAFVLHDMFAVPFVEISAILQCAPASVRQLASRARRRVQGPQTSLPSIRKQREVIETFLAALRIGDLHGVLAVLDPAVVRRADSKAVSAIEKREIVGRTAVAEEAVTNIARARFARMALIGGNVGIIVAPRGKLTIALLCKVRAGKIVEFDVVAIPEHLKELDISPLPGGNAPGSEKDHKWRSTE